MKKKIISFLIIVGIIISSSNVFYHPMTNYNEYEIMPLDDFDDLLTTKK